MHTGGVREASNKLLGMGRRMALRPNISTFSTNLRDTH